MVKVLVIGGTRYVGKRLVRALLARNWEVSVLSRGNILDSIPPAARRLKADRGDATALTAALGDGKWDLVYDQVCFTPQDARAACEIFSGRAKRYIMTSTVAVYELQGRMMDESSFDPLSHTGSGERGDYVERKRGMEEELARRAEFEWVTPRFPIILGPDDPHLFLHREILRVFRGETIGVPHNLTSRPLISADEAAEALLFLAESSVSGALNACSDEPVNGARVLDWIAEKTMRTPKTRAFEERARQSLLFREFPAELDTTKARRAGLCFKRVRDWLPAMIDQLVASAHRKGLANAGLTAYSDK
jgi:nucleoside-diphosphate-sugar epimerase